MPERSPRKGRRQRVLPGGEAQRRRAGEAASRPPGRPPGGSGDLTRERIMKAAVSTFAQRGLAGSSVRDIAREARIRVSSLYHYFPSKEALYREVVDRYQNDIRNLVVGVLGKGLDVREAARETVGQLFDYLLTNRSIAQLSYRSSVEGGADVFFQDENSRWLGFAEGFLKPAELRGEVKGVDPIAFMVTMDALVHWHIIHDSIYRTVLGRGLDDPELARRTREHVIQVALRTLGLE